VKKAKQPKCKHCKERFTPVRSTLEKHCLKKECVAAWIDTCHTYTERKKAKDWKVKKKKMKESLKTNSDWIKEVQVVFNAYIRQRDIGLPCISCGLKSGAKMNAGHYRSVGNCPSLRFDERNCYLQCEACNSYLSGNLIEYRKNLVKKFGAEFVDFLEAHPKPKHYTIPELIVLKEVYKEKLRSLMC